MTIQVKGQRAMMLAKVLYDRRVSVRVEIDQHGYWDAAVRDDCDLRRVSYEDSSHLVRFDDPERALDGEEGLLARA